MVERKLFKFELELNAEQQRRLNAFASARRFVYNWRPVRVFLGSSFRRSSLLSRVSSTSHGCRSRILNPFSKPWLISSGICQLLPETRSLSAFQASEGYTPAFRHSAACEDCTWMLLGAENRLDQNSSVAAGRLPDQKRDLRTRCLRPLV
jgi:hypothetical protein